MKKLSVIIPIFNEEAIISPLIERLNTTQKDLCKTFKWRADAIEIIFVTDQPTDETLPLLQAYCSSHVGYKCLNLSQRVGQYIAIKAGIQESTGEAIVIMDADLQDPPECIEPMMKLYREGVDVVYGVRKKRTGETLVYKGCCSVYYWLLSKLISIKLPKKSGEFRLLSRRAANAVLACNEANIFFRGLTTWVGFKQRPFYYDRDARFGGDTHYSFKRSCEYAVDGIVSFSSKPLRLITYLGCLISLAGFVYAGYVMYLKLVLKETGEGWASLIIIILALGGFQLMALGIIGEYIGRIYTESKQRPLYFIQDVFEKKQKKT